MSQLAYTLAGESFELPGNAVAWKVRRIKKQGAPEVVFGHDGVPLILPIDADMDDLRNEARVHGKYRVDALDDSGKPIAGCPAGYVCILGGEPAVAEESGTVAKPGPMPTTADQALVEAMRIQAGLAQSVVDNFSMMLEAAATLITSAQHAGMPQRLPRFFLDAEPSEDETPKASSAPESAPTPVAPKSGMMAFFETFAQASAPAIVNAIVNGKIKIPGGLGALLDCRRAVPKDHDAAAIATLIPGAVPAPGPNDPAPAGPVTGASVSPPSGGATVGAEASPPASVGDTTVVASPAAGVASVPDGLPIFDPETIAHFRRILDALTLREQMHAQALVGELTGAELRAWVEELKALSIEAGVAKIRAVIGRTAGNPGTVPGDGNAGALGDGGVS